MYIKVSRLLNGSGCRAEDSNALHLDDLISIKLFEQKILFPNLHSTYCRSMHVREAETDFPRRWDDRTAPLFVDVRPWRVSAKRASQGNAENGP